MDASPDSETQDASSAPAPGFVDQTTLMFAPSSDDEQDAQPRSPLSEYDSTEEHDEDRRAKKRPAAAASGDDDGAGRARPRLDQAEPTSPIARLLSRVDALEETVGALVQRLNVGSSDAGSDSDRSGSPDLFSAGY